MFVERQVVLCKRGRYQELEDLVAEWAKKFAFPRAKAFRHYFSYIGQQGRAFCFEAEFETLDDLQKGWEEWDDMAEDMAPFLEKWRDLIEESISSELWRVKHVG
ncbi:MAG: hypothetical protein R3293_18390 [Candidatus Promineifilaceae bacterium]|nr:hypothetical protein [Candidatus Promineifilaceae bacterium]